MVISSDSAAAFHFFIQDPVYGKGKLGEIQGLVLGMLDTFNYEQVSSVHFCLLLYTGITFSYLACSLSFAISLCRAK